MSSDEYVSRVNADPEKTPLERMVEKYAKHLGVPFVLRFDRYTDRQVLAVMLERLLIHEKGTLELLKLTTEAAAHVFDNRERALQPWCEQYMEINSIGE